MRTLIKKGINIEEHVALPETTDGLIPLLGENNPTVLKILDNLKEHFDFVIKPESYWRIEHNPEGHPWHVDTGDTDHMLWCQVGCTILLTSNTQFSGGETFYDREEPVLVERDLYDIAAHTSDEWHMVTPHSGNRTVLLLFI